MNDVEPRSHLICFAAFELDFPSRELRKHGVKVKLHGQPLEILAMLLERPGEIVTREEIRARLWPQDTFVDFEHSVNSAVKRLRSALGDSPSHIRFIETLPRLGYRFIAQVGAAAPGSVHASPDIPAVPPWRGFWIGAAAALGLLVASATVFVALNAFGVRDRLVHRTWPMPKIESIAVLPLENLSGDPEQEYFADGMTEVLVTNLGKVSALRVISRTSVMRYKGTKKPLPEIARELNVDAVVEGTVLRSGDKVRITANLLDARHDRHLWAETYESNLRDVLVVQGDAARTIVNAIKIKIAPQEQTALTNSRPVVPEAYDAYLLGRYQWDRRTEQSLQRAQEYFERAIAIDPGYAAAYAGLADSYTVLGDNGLRRPNEVFPQAKAAATKALQLDPSLAEAHTSLASVMKAYEWDWRGSESEFQRAIELNPSYSTARQFHGELLECVGRYDDAVAELRRARELDPFAPRIHTILAWTLYLARRYDEGIAEAQKGLEIDRYHAALFFVRAELYLQKGMYPEALADYHEAESLFPGPYYPRLGLARGYARSGQRRMAREVLAELNDVAKHRYVMPSSMAAAYSDFGDKERALAWLEKAYTERDPWLGLTVRSEPAFDPLRPDPRFQSLLRRMNFPQ
jgi:TolB-like protein/DNA-binding winged helix-turn-helix (wHTH) protein/Tfp pilus assembly protein PilF